MSRKRRWTLLLVAIVAATLLFVGGFTRDAGTPGRAPSPERTSRDEPEPPAPAPEPAQPAAEPAAPAEPTPQAVEAPPPRQLPECYFGEIKVEGVVRDQAGTLMPGMCVECVPCTINPGTPDRLARFLCTSDEDGKFLLDALPEASRYAFRASGPGAYGEATHIIDDIRSSVVEVTVSSTISYERYDFYDQDGQPIDVRGRLRLMGLGTAGGIWSSSLGVDPEREVRFARVGVPMRDLPSNVAVTVYTYASPARQVGPAGAIVVPVTVNVAGYEPASIEPVRIRPSEWPRSTRVTLRADGSAWTRYEVRFPSLPWVPPADAAPEIEALWDRLVLCARVEGAEYEDRVSKRRPRFWAPRGMPFEMHILNGDVPVPHEVKETAQGAIVELRMPELTVPVFRYDLATTPWSGLRDVEQLHVQIEEGGKFIPGRQWRPGLVLFDPMTPATVTIRCVWPQGRDFVNRVKGPLALEPGVCEIRWEPTTEAAEAR